MVHVALGIVVVAGAYVCSCILLFPEHHITYIDPMVLTDVPQVKNLMTPIVLDGLNCRGDEVNLGHCEREPVVEYCSHSDDAGANCTRIIGW